LQKLIKQISKQSLRISNNRFLFKAMSNVYHRIILPERNKWLPAILLLSFIKTLQNFDAVPVFCNCKLLLPLIPVMNGHSGYHKYYQSTRQPFASAISLDTDGNAGR
jgi:hypothetical protein